MFPDFGKFLDKITFGKLQLLDRGAVEYFVNLILKAVDERKKNRVVSMQKENWDHYRKKFRSC